jgi:predicted transcriptional regulator
MGKRLLTSEQIRGARSMLRLEQTELADRAGVSLETIKRIEKTPGTISALVGTLDKIRRALESAGVIFVEEDGEGPGVRLKKGK